MQKKVVIIDNYDSFTYNLVHLVNEIIGGEVQVVRNDEYQLSDLNQYEYIILSPGPGVPDEAGLLKKTIAKYKGTKKIFGVCLGLQAIAEVYGAKLKNLDKVKHGLRTEMSKTTEESVILADVPDKFYAGRYHSWVIDKRSDVSALVVTATGEDNEIMAARHISDTVYGVQFHPESIMTDDGRTMLENFLKS